MSLPGAFLLLDLGLTDLAEGCAAADVAAAAARRLGADPQGLAVFKLEPGQPEAAPAGWAVQLTARPKDLALTHAAMQEQAAEVGALRARGDKLSEALRVLDARCRELDGDLSAARAATARANAAAAAAASAAAAAGSPPAPPPATPPPRPPSADGPPRSAPTAQRLRYVEERNKALGAECADLRDRLRKAEVFQRDVLGTVQGLKLQLAQLTEELVLSSNWGPDGPTAAPC
eukprot:TRINITY_DN10775_c0_g1_i1.p2 TRINITY_DN10775_c0_g1~~TRINITY_DN10775_c0_g1_i1.p2  ORF type:complete len:261 (+),score=108.50 TRINITY_DN10775_c0_g1_i1:88-783(+)